MICQGLNPDLLESASQVVLVVKNPPANAGDSGSVPGSGRSPGGRHGNPLQYSCWRIPWTEEPDGLQSIGVAKSWIRLKCLSMHEYLNPNPGSIHKIQFSSVAQLCPTLCDPMNCSMPGLPVHHQLPAEFTQIHVHRVDDAIQPSHPLSSPSPPILNVNFYY